MRKKRITLYPKLNTDLKAIVLNHILAAREDFENGFLRMRSMGKLSKDQWILNNISYYRNCISASDYIIDKLQLFAKKKVR
jgi:hypothetical protein